MLPYLPQHLRALGLSGSEIGVLAGASPLMAFLAPPLWGFLADRTRRGALLLTLAALGSLTAFSPLLSATTTATIAPWMLLAAFFSTPISMLADSLTLERLRESGGDYARIRLWGSVGFIVATTAFGLLYTGERSSPPPVIVAALLTTAGALVASLFVHGRGEAQAPVALGDALTLLGDRRIRILLAATCLHWLSCSPYHMLFTVHLKDLGLPPSVAGIGFGVGVLAEVVVMMNFPRLAARLAPRKILALAFAASSLRWLLVGLSSSATVLVGLQLLHGLTFGAFLCAAISYLGAVVPPRLRGTGQALYVSVTYGIGGLVGYLLTGKAYDLLGARATFFGGAVLEWLPALLVLSLPALEAVEPVTISPVVASTETTP